MVVCDVFGLTPSRLLPMRLYWIMGSVNESIGDGQSRSKVLDILLPQFVLGQQLEAFREIVELVLIHLWVLKHQHEKFLHVFSDGPTVLEPLYC